jgi:hypothetical protein
MAVFHQEEFFSWIGYRIEPNSPDASHFGHEKSA